MASCNFLCLALIFALSFSTLEVAFGARSLATTTTSGEQAELVKKPIFKQPQVELPPKKPVTLAKVEVHPSNPKAQKGLDQSLYPSFDIPKGFNIPGSFNIPRSFGFPPLDLAPYLSSPSLPFPDLPLVPAIPLTPPSLPVTSSTTSKKENDQSP